MALTMLALALAALATAEWLPEDVCESPDCALNALQLRANKTEQMEEAENRPREYCAKDVKISCKHGSCPNNKGVCDPHSKQCMCPHGQCELQGRCTFWLYNGPATRMCKQDTGHKCGNGHGECPPYRGVCSKDGRCMCRGELCAQDGKCQIDPVHLKRGFKWQKHTRLRLRDTELKCNRNSDCPTLRSGPMSCEKRKCLCFDGFEWNKKAEMCMQWPRGPPSHTAPSGHPPPASPSAQAPAPMAPAPMPMAPATAAPTAAAPATAAPTAAAPATAAPTAAAPAPAASPDIANMDWSKMDWSTFDWGSIDWGAMFNPQGAGAGAAPEGAPAPAPGAGGFDWTSIDWGAMWNPQGTGYPGAAPGVPAWNVR